MRSKYGIELPSRNGPIHFNQYRETKSIQRMTENLYDIINFGFIKTKR
jgi:hypothetical protein